MLPPSLLGARESVRSSWLNYTTRFKPKDMIPIPWMVALALQSAGWYLRQDIIWHKPNPMPESVTDRCTKAHEYLFLLAKSERYFWDAAAMQEPSDPQWKSRYDSAFTGRPDLVMPDGKPQGVAMTGMREWKETRNRRSVWTVPTQPYSGAHFAVFPAELIEPCVLAGSRPGDVILDPFMGSGTTAQVAQALGRQWIGCELNSDYAPLQFARTAQQSMAFE
jgi:site-specific DNA-methyltransferase (cytosine-N4-specific)